MIDSVSGLTLSGNIGQSAASHDRTEKNLFPGSWAPQATRMRDYVRLPLVWREGNRGYIFGGRRSGRVGFYANSFGQRSGEADMGLFYVNEDVGLGSGQHDYGGARA